MTVPRDSRTLIGLSVLLLFVGCDSQRIPEAKATRQVIQVCDWHYVPKELFIADLRTDNPQYSDEELDQDYAQHLVDVEAVQAEQIQHLRILLHEHKLKRVWVEGLTSDDMPAFQELVKQVKAVKEQEVPKRREQFEEAEQLIHKLEASGKQGSEEHKQVLAIREKMRELLKEHREQLLRIGAAGRMLLAGELAEVLPLDDEAAHKAANPLQAGGEVVLDAAKIEDRETAMVERLLTADEPVAAIVLGAKHDLVNQLEGTGVEYKRVVPSRVEAMMDTYR